MVLNYFLPELHMILTNYLLYNKYFFTETYKPNLQKVCASAEPRFKDQKASRIERILSNKRLVEMLTERKEKKTIDKSKLLQKMNQIYLK